MRKKLNPRNYKNKIRKNMREIREIYLFLFLLRYSNVMAGDNSSYEMFTSDNFRKDSLSVHPQHVFVFLREKLKSKSVRERARRATMPQKKDGL